MLSAEAARPGPALRCVAQDGKLPLHYAAEKGASSAVVELLLRVQRTLNTAAASDKARRCAATTALTQHLGPMSPALYIATLAVPCCAVGRLLAEASPRAPALAT